MENLCEVCVEVYMYSRGEVGQGEVVLGRSGLKMYEIGKNLHHLNKRYKTRIKGTKFEKKLRNSKRRYKIEKKIFENKKGNIDSQFRETTRNTFFVFSYFLQFRETIETRRNSDLFRTVSYFAKLKKYETVNPSAFTPDLHQVLVVAVLPDL